MKYMIFLAVLFVACSEEDKLSEMAPPIIVIATYPNTNDWKDACSHIIVHDKNNKVLALRAAAYAKDYQKGDTLK